MSRIRYLKPDFFLDEDVAELSFPARLLFQGLWVLADREGRLEDRPTFIRVQVFPYDSQIAIGDLLDELAKPRKHSAGAFILRYTVGDQRYIQIKNFAAHQKPHHKEAPSEIPPPPDPGKVRASRGKVRADPGKVGADPEKASASRMGMGMGMGMGNGEWGMGNGVAPPDGAARPEPDTPSERPWSVEACEDWQRCLGKPPGDRIGSALKPLVGKHGWDVVRPVWQWANQRAAASDAPEKWTPQGFARAFEALMKRREDEQAGRSPTRGSPKARDEPASLMTPEEWRKNR